MQNEEGGINNVTPIPAGDVIRSTVYGNRNIIGKNITVFINESAAGEDSNEGSTFPELHSLSFRGEESVFVGREEYIDKKIKDYLNIPGSRVSIIGPGGSGKSQLAFKAIRQYYEKEGIFDVVIPIYFDSGIMTFDEFLSEVSRKLFLNRKQKTEFQSVGTEERQDIIRNSLLGKTHPLIYADNFETLSFIINNADSAEKEQPRQLEAARLIKNFLNNEMPENTSVLLTSRERNNLGGREKRIDLEGLNKNESNELFSKLVVEDYLKNPTSEGIKQKINNLLEKTGGHPLSIEVMASNITNVEEIEQMSESLRDKVNPDEPIERLHSLKASFDYTISKLDNKVKDILQSLTFFKSPFPISAAQKIFGATVEDITNLFSRSLLSRIESDDFYGKIENHEYWLYNFHPAVRNYLEDEITQIGDRNFEEPGELFSEYYYDLLVETDNAIGREKHKPALARFNIIFQGKSNDFERAIEIATDHRLIAEISNIIGNILLRIGMFSKSLQYFKRTLEIDRELDRKESIAWDYNNMGIVLQNMGKYEDALNYHKKCLDTFEELNCEKEMAWGYSGIGLIFMDMGKYEEALNYHKKCLDISERLLPPEEVQKDYANQAEILIANGNNDEALVYYKKALAIAERLNDREKIASDYNGIAYALSAIGNNDDEALEYNKKALAITESLNIRPLLASSYSVKGGLLQNINKNDEALECYKKALAIHKELDHRVAMATDYNIIGVVHRNMGEYKEAVEYHKKSMDLFEELDNRFQAAGIYSELGLSLEYMGNYDEALEYYKKALAIHEELDDRGAIANDYCNMGIASIGKYEETIMYCEKALKINPNHVDALYYKGLALYNLSKYDEATIEYDKALKINPNHVILLDNKSYALFQLNRLDEAIECSDKAIKFDPSHATAWYNRSCYMVRKGKINNALKDLQEATRLDESFTESAKTDKDFDPIRDDERFKKLIS